MKIQFSSTNYQKAKTDINFNGRKVRGVPLSKIEKTIDVLLQQLNYKDPGLLTLTDNRIAMTCNPYYHLTKGKTHRRINNVYN